MKNSSNRWFERRSSSQARIRGTPTRVWVSQAVLQTVLQTKVCALFTLTFLLGGASVLASPLPAQNSSSDQSASNIVPFKLYNDNLIVVKATIGPIKNVNFIVDTGTNPSAITPKIAERLQLSGTVAAVDTLQGTIQTESILVPDILVGPLHTVSIRVVVQDLSFVERSLGIPLAGLIGLDILNASTFTIDYRNKNIAFGLAVTANSVHFENTIPLLMIKAKLAGNDIRLIADSGIAGLLIYRNRLPRVPMQVTVDPITSISTVGGTTHLKQFRATLSLGENNLGAHDLLVADVDSDPKSEFDGLLGFTKMGFHRVSFDFKNGLFGWE